jgi:phosphonoacetaldehyde hydrolase
MIRLVVFDWAGTTVDFGSLAPIVPVRQAFAARGVAVSVAEARAPMGLPKKDHLRELLRQPAVAARWQEAQGRPWTGADVEALYQDFIPLQMAALEQHSGLVPGLLECVAHLRQRGVKIAATTGYFRAAAAAVTAAAARQGYEPDAALCPDDVPAGRPAPWMIFRHMERLGAYPPSAVVKVGDTPVDMAEGRNAGAWAVGVTASGSLVGCSAEEWSALPGPERLTRCDSARRALLAAGAHAVLGSLEGLPALIDDLGQRGSDSR